MTHKLKLIVLVLLSVIITSCSKDDGPSDGGTTFQVDIDGATFKTNTTISQLVGGLTDAFSVIATNTSGTGETVTLNINLASPADFKVATFPLSSGILSSITYTPNSSSPNSFIDTNIGEVIITELDTTNKVASGTFSGTAENFTTGEKVVLTNGVFTNITYTNTSL